MSKKTLSAIAAFLVALGTLIGALVDSDPSPTTKTIATVNTEAPATPAQVAEAPPAGELQSSPEEVDQLQDPTPNEVPVEVLDKAEEHNDRLQENLDPQPVGGAQGYSIRKLNPLTTAGFGAFRSKVNEFCLHYTVSPNIPNSWADIYNVENYLQRVGLNATFLADFDGHILQAGSTDRNPYTQGWFNQYCESVEIIATGKESRQEWLNSRLIKKGILAAFVRDRLRARGIPIRFVDPVDCNAPLGWTDHLHMECGNDHVDVGPNFPYKLFQKQMMDGPKPACGKRCRHVKHVRAKHQRTHRLIVKRKCSAHQSPKGYCEKLRKRNRYVHKVAKRDKISLKGTYR